MQRFLVFVCFLIFTPLYSQVYNPAYKNLISVVNDSNVTLYNYQVRIEVNTAALVADGKLNPDGSDLRFSPDACSPSIFYSFWIESFFNTDSTIIWIKIPQLDSLATHEVFVWYGDSLAISMSDFNSTFPSSYISNGNDTVLGGVQFFDWFQLDSGDVVSLPSQQPLELHSRVIRLSGHINGTGMGFMSPAGLGVGGGPGGGGPSSNAGAGGGSHAGVGGTGGFDFGDSPGTGGPANGNLNEMNFEMGSAGGSTDNAMGGNGGGAIWLDAEYININGAIFMNGNDGVGSIGRCGGGGAGGSIIVTGSSLGLGPVSQFQVKGGNGGDGVSAANDGGGGGSGGRIKLFHNGLPIHIDSTSFLGGEGGTQGSQSFGQNGEYGTSFDSIVTFSYPHCIIGSELALQATILNLDSVYCLIKDSVHLLAEPPGGVFAGPGVIGGYFFPLTAGVGIHTITYTYNDPFGCGALFTSQVTEVLNIPAFPVATNNGPLCENETLQLSVSDSNFTYHWIGPNGFESPIQSPQLMNVSSADSGMYTVTITNPSGCTSGASTVLIVHGTPDATVTNNGPLCISAELQLVASGGLNYSWTGPNGFTSFSSNPAILHSTPLDEGIYTVTITGTGGCTTVAITEVVIDDCYDHVDEHPVNTVTLFPNPAINEVIVEFQYGINSSLLQYQLVDMQGKYIQPKIIFNSPLRIIMDVSDLPLGLYHLKVYSNEIQGEYRFLKQ